MIKWFGCLALFSISASVWGGGINDNKKRAEEVKTQMWSASDKDFTVTQIPDKWKNEEAVVLAKTNTLYYRKTALVSNLHYDSYFHQRVKLLSTKAIEDYAQFKFDGSSASYSLKLEVYAGVKIIKPDGKEIEITVDQAVKETESFNRYQRDIYKLAIPNLAVGDIIDYYIVKERTINLSGTRYYTFDPVIFELNGEYPILKQKISFEVLRRCYINLKTLNGAPSFKLKQDKDDNNYYSLEDQDRESVKNMRWFMPYRELPTIKFKITYASSMAAGIVPGFIGEPGVLRSKVSTEDVKDLLAFYFRYLEAHPAKAELKSYMNKNFKGITDQEKIAKEAYYALRNIRVSNNAEGNLLEGKEDELESNTSMILLSEYYKSKKIPHEFLIGVPRQISSLDDLIYENELTFMLKVNTGKPFYIGRFDAGSMPGEIDPDLQGETVFTASGLVNPKSWYLQKAKVPVADAQSNNSTTSYSITFSDLNQGTAKVVAKKSSTGLSRVEYQNSFMDFYTYSDEEKKKFQMKDNKSFEKRMAKQKTDYLANRPEQFKKKLKESIKDDFELKEEEEVTEPVVEKTGRFESDPAFTFTYEATLKGLVKRAGPNYLVDIGKFIEGQAQITKEERDRKYNVYLPIARSMNYQIELTIPQGYAVSGVEKLNSKIENNSGGFTSTAKVEGGKLIITTSKVYKTNYVSKADWLSVVSFLDAAYDFSKMQVLLEKR